MGTLLGVPLPVAAGVAVSLAAALTVAEGVGVGVGVGVSVESPHTIEVTKMAPLLPTAVAAPPPT